MRELRDPRDIFSKIWYYDKVLMIEDLQTVATIRMATLWIDIFNEISDALLTQIIREVSYT